MTAGKTSLEATYILPIKQSAADADGDLAGYLAWLGERLDVIVVDASPPDVFVENEFRWQNVRHVRPLPEREVANGKVWGVLTGLDLALHERIVIGDDDVRYDEESLAEVLALLARYDVVRPQNYFRPLPWHAVWDTGRSLLNRMSGGDWPGTLAVRRSVLSQTSGYDGDCSFENLEMVRTVKAAGGSEWVALDVFVPRRPPSARHFWSQRVRQAYDEYARPARLAFQLTWLPLQLALLVRRPTLLVPVYAAVVTLAESGRRRKNGSRVFPVAGSFAAPVWVIERSLCAWLAVLSRLTRGGVTYRGGVIAKAASSPAALKARYALEESTR